MPLKFTLSNQRAHQTLDLRSEVRVRSNDTPSMPRDYNGMSKAEMLLGVANLGQDVPILRAHRGLKKKASNMSLIIHDIKNAWGNTPRRPSRCESPLRSCAHSAVSCSSTSNNVLGHAVRSTSGLAGTHEPSTGRDDSTAVTAQVTIPRGQSVIMENLAAQGYLSAKQRHRLPAHRKALRERSEENTGDIRYNPTPPLPPLETVRRLPSQRIYQKPEVPIYNINANKTQSVRQPLRETRPDARDDVQLYESVNYLDEEVTEMVALHHSPLSLSEESSISVHTLTSKITNDTVTPAHRLVIQRPKEVTSQKHPNFDVFLELPVSPQSPGRVHRLTGTDLQLESVLSLSESESDSDSDSYGSSFQYKHTSMSSVESDTLPTPKARKRLSRTSAKHDTQTLRIQLPQLPPPSRNSSIDTWAQNGMSDGSTVFLISTPVDRLPPSDLDLPFTPPQSVRGPLTSNASSPRMMGISKNEVNVLETIRTQRQRAGTVTSSASSHLTVPSISHSPSRKHLRGASPRSRSRSNPRVSQQQQEIITRQIDANSNRPELEAENEVNGLGIYNFPAPPGSPPVSRKVSITTLLDPAEPGSPALPESPETVPRHQLTPTGIVTAMVGKEAAEDLSERPQTALWLPVSPASTSTSGGASLERALSPTGRGARGFHLPTMSERPVELGGEIQARTRKGSVARARKAVQERLVEGGEDFWRGRAPSAMYGYDWMGGAVTAGGGVAIGEAV